MPLFFERLIPFQTGLLFVLFCLLCLVLILCNFRFLDGILGNWKWHITLSLFLTACFSYCRNSIFSIVDCLFSFVPIPKFTLFSLTLIVCFILYFCDQQKKKGLRFSWFSVPLLSLFAIEWGNMHHISSCLANIVFFVVCSLIFMCLEYTRGRPNQGVQQQKKDDVVLLGREKMYRRICSHIRFLAWDGGRENQAEGSKAIAIYGRWGEGKTHLLHYLEKELQKDISQHEPSIDETKDRYTGAFHICKISIWKYHSLDEAWKEITSVIMSQLLGYRYQINKRFVYLANKIIPQSDNSKLKALYSLWNLVYNNTELFTTTDEESAYSVVEINQHITNKKVVLIFDDVERANIKIIQALLPLIERLKKIKNLIIICALAHEELCDLYHRKKRSTRELQGLLDKIFDFSFQLTSASSYSLDKMRDTLIKKNDTQYPLSSSFFKECRIQFDTPRQLERVVTLITSLEKTYFYDAEITETEDFRFQRNIRPEFVVFLVEILRALYIEVCIEAKKGEHPYNLVLFNDFPNFLNPVASELNSSNEKEEDKKRWIRKYPETYRICRSNMLLKYLLSNLKICNKDDILDALNGNYTKRISMTKEESLDFIKKCQGNVSEPVNEMLEEHYGSANNAPENVEDAIQNMLYYALKNIGDDYHSQFVQSLFEKEIGNKQLSPFLYDCFFPLFYFYVEKHPDLHIENTLKTMINKMEFKRVARVLRELGQDVPNFEENISMLFEFTACVYLKNNLVDEEYWYIDENMSTLKERSFSSIVNLLCEKYACQLTKEILNEKGNKYVLNNDNYNFLHIFHYDYKQKYVMSFIQGVDKYVEEQICWNNKSLKYLLDFLAMKALWENADHGLDVNEPILSLSVQTWRIFDKLITKLIDMPEQYGEQLADNYLENLSKECESSHSFFERYRKENNSRLVRLECEKGAEKLKECIERIRQKVSQRSRRCHGDATCAAIGR